MKAVLLLLFIFTVSFFSSYHAAYAQAAKMLQSMSDEELEIRQWSLNSVMALMTFNHDNFLQRLESNKELLSLNGCKRFLWIMDLFEIRENAEKKQQTVITTPPSRYPLKYTLGIITYRTLEEKRLDRLGLPADAKVWDLEIPLTVEFQDGPRKMRYNFFADIRVQRVEDPEHYVIRSWTPYVTKKTMKPRGDHQKYVRSRYDECDQIDFVDLSD